MSNDIKENARELWAYARIEEYNNKLFFYGVFLAGMAEWAAHEIFFEMDSCPEVNRHKMKMLRNNLNKTLNHLRADIERFEKEDILPTICRGADAFIKTYDGVGNLTSRVQQMFHQELKREMTIWQSCTHNAVANHTEHHSNLMCKLYEFNGYCSMANSLFSTLQDYAKEVLHDHTKKIKHQNMMFTHLEQLKDIALNMCENLQAADVAAMCEDKWWKNSCIALNNITLKMVSDTITDKVNDCIYQSINDYIDWYMANTILYWKYNDELPERVKQNARTYLTQRGEMMRFTNEVKQLANKSEQEDVWSILDEMEVIKTESHAMVSKFMERALNWAEDAAERIHQKKENIKNALKDIEDGN